MEGKKRCCIATCKGERFDLAHKFPRSSEIAQAWLEAIDNPNLKSLNLKKLNESYQVCARHFRITDYKHPQSRSLNKLAVPSLNLINLNQLHLARDSNPRAIATNVSIETDASSVLRKNDPLINSAAVEDEDFDTSELIECVEMTSSEADVDPINNHSDFAEENKITLKVTDFSDVFEIIHPKYGKPLYLNAFCLRFNCDCSDCLDSETKRKKITFMDIPRNIQPKTICQLESLDSLIIEWEDGHCSTHDVELLFKMQTNKVKFFSEKLPFDSNSLKKPSQIEFSKLVCLDEKIEKIFKNLFLHGFACVTGIPTQNTSMAKLAIQRIFPNQQTINFEPFNEIHSDICTNFTCTNIDCGLKCFFATQKSEIVLVDGLNIAEKLKKSQSYAFNVLKCTDVPLKMRDNNVCHEILRPIIQMDDDMEESTRIQLDTQRMFSLNMLPQVDVQNFYDSLELFMKMIRTNENQILLNLEPGTIIILDNWRVLHKLLSNVGVFQCYMSRNDYIGRSRYLGLLS